MPYLSNETAWTKLVKLAQMWNFRAKCKTIRTTKFCLWPNLDEGSVAKKLRFWGQKFEEETSIAFETKTKFCNAVSQMYTILLGLIIEMLRQIFYQFSLKNLSL